MSISIIRTIPLSGEEKPDVWDDYGWDIDRWENDGGRSLGKCNDFCEI